MFVLTSRRAPFKNLKQETSGRSEILSRHRVGPSGPVGTAPPDPLSDVSDNLQPIGALVTARHDMRSSIFGWPRGAQGTSRAGAPGQFLPFLLQVGDWAASATCSQRETRLLAILRGGHRQPCLNGAQRPESNTPYDVLRSNFWFTNIYILFIIFWTSVPRRVCVNSNDTE